MPPCRVQAEHSARKPRSARLARDGRSWSWCRDHSIGSANGSLSVANFSRDVPWQTDKPSVDYLVQQTAPAAALCHGFLRDACRLRARSLPAHAAAGVDGTSCCEARDGQTQVITKTISLWRCRVTEIVMCVTGMRRGRTGRWLKTCCMRGNILIKTTGYKYFFGYDRLVPHGRTPSQCLYCYRPAQTSPQSIQYIRKFDDLPLSGL